jgi:hypothetical protein
VRAIVDKSGDHVDAVLPVRDVHANTAHRTVLHQTSCHIQKRVKAALHPHSAPAATSSQRGSVICTAAHMRVSTLNKKACHALPNHSKHFGS